METTVATLIQLLPFTLLTGLIALIIHFSLLINKYLKLKSAYYKLMLKKLDEEQ